jgi:hypothetical protein
MGEPRREKALRPGKGNGVTQRTGVRCGELPRGRASRASNSGGPQATAAEKRGTPACSAIPHCLTDRRPESHDVRDLRPSEDRILPPLSLTDIVLYAPPGICTSSRSVHLHAPSPMPLPSPDRSPVGENDGFDAANCD